MARIGVRKQEQEKRDPDCDSRDQEIGASIAVLPHLSSSLAKSVFQVACIGERHDKALFVAQRLNGIQIGSLPRRVDAEDQPDGAGAQERNHDP